MLVPYRREAGQKAFWHVQYSGRYRKLVLVTLYANILNPSSVPLRRAGAERYKIRYNCKATVCHSIELAEISKGLLIVGRAYAMP
jgi:hypothetical protein